MKVIHENIFKELINNVAEVANNNPDSDIIWCGENVWLYRILEILSTVDISVKAVVDNSPKKRGIKTEYYEIFGFDYVLSTNDKAMFFICNLRSQEILSQLLSLGVARERIYIFRPIEFITQKFEQNFIYDMYDKEPMSHTRLQETLFEILLYFRNFCDRYGLRYYLYDGTLIGAVRHKGFIPWDDDIDVCMPYEDYLRLVKLFENTKQYSLISWDRDENYEFSWAKIIDNRTKMLHPGNTIMGCYIDIFILGGYPSEQRLIQKKWEQYRQAEKNWHSYYVLRDTSIEVDDCRNEIIKKLYAIPYDAAKYIGVMRSERQKAWVAPREWFDNAVNLEFCGEKFMAPGGYDSYLQMKYGDYMTVPEVAKRDIHGFVAYKM